MSDQQRKQTWDDVYSLFVIIFLIIIVVDWCLYNSVISPDLGNLIWVKIISGFYKLQNVLILFRLFYVIALSLFAWNMNSVKLAKKMNKDHRLYYRVLFFVLSPLVILGYHSDVYIYDFLFYPVLFLTHLYITVRAINTFKKNLKDESILGGISSEESNFYFSFVVENGQILMVHKPQQHIYIEGGPGSGKSQSIIKPIIEQAATRGYAGLIYDFEGDPREDDAPILGRIAYTALKRTKEKNKDIKTNFSFVNFTDMGKTVRVNPLSTKYIEDRLDVQDLVQNMMTNLSVNKGKGGDFWEKYGTAYIYGITWNLFKNYSDSNFNTLPHVITVALEDIDTVLRWCWEGGDPEVKKIMAPLFSAWRSQAHGQLAGAESSAQLPISILFDPKLFWVLSVDEFNLDITNKENPYLLCIGNSKKLQQALAPVISVLLTIIMKQMNSPGKNKSVFIFDEFPTVKVNGIDTFIATVRKHYCAVILALQDFTQSKRDYSPDNANILRTSCGTHMYGMTGNLDTGKYVSGMLGEVKKESVSYSTSNDNLSTSESLQKEKVLQERDIMGQSIGHFTGKIAGGKPPFFSTQFSEFKYIDEPIPDFALRFETGDTDCDKSILNNLVQENYLRIIKEADDLLEPYKKENWENEEDDNIESY